MKRRSMTYMFVYVLRNRSLARILGLAVDSESLLDAGRLARDPPARRRIQCSLHERRNGGKSEATGKKFRDRYLIGGVQDCRRRPAGFERLAGQPQARESARDRAARRSGSPSRSDSSPRAGSRIRSGQARQCEIGIAHVGRTELRDHRTVDGIRRCHARSIADARTRRSRAPASRTGDAPRSVRDPCSSGSRNRS